MTARLPRSHIDPGYARSRRNLLAAVAISLAALAALIVLSRAYAHHAARWWALAAALAASMVA